MKKFFSALVLSLAVCGIVNSTIINPANVMAISDSDIDKILRAKDIVRAMVNYPDTLVFHEFSTKVSGNTVTLKFTCKNAFGVPETHTMNITVD
jgi:hypothetical protein